MKKKMTGVLSFIAACAILACSTSASDKLISANPRIASNPTAEEVSETEETAEAVEGEAVYTVAAVNVDGKEKVEITSAVCDLLPNVSLSCIFDSIEETQMSVAYDEEAETKTVNVYVVAAGPVVADTFAVKMGGEEGTVVGINVYATNDSTLEDWYRLTVNNPAEDKDGFKIFSVKEFARKFTYYKFEFVLLTGDSYSLTELALYCDEGEGSLVTYESDGEVEAGDTPTATVKSTKTNEEKAIPVFDTFGIRFAH